MKNAEIRVEVFEAPKGAVERLAAAFKKFSSRGRSPKRDSNKMKRSLGTTKFGKAF